MLTYWCRRLGCSFLPLAGPGLVWGLLMWSIVAERGDGGKVACRRCGSNWRTPNVGVSHRKKDTWQRKHGWLFGITARWGAIFHLFSPHYFPSSHLKNDIAFRREKEGCHWILVFYSLLLVTNCREGHQSQKQVWGLGVHHGLLWPS